MNTLMNIFDEVGYNGPNILIVLSMYLLWNNNNMFFYYVVGQLLDFILNPILKTIIQQPRPCFDSKELQLALKNNKRFLYKDGIPYDIFGMPSGHAESAAFSTAFVYLALRKTNWLYVYLIMTAIVMYQRVNTNEHTILQVIIGAIVGVVFANTMYYFSEKNIQGRIREKPDDNGPI